MSGIFVERRLSPLIGGNSIAGPPRIRARNALAVPKPRICSKYSGALVRMGLRESTALRTVAIPRGDLMHRSHSCGRLNEFRRSASCEMRSALLLILLSELSPDLPSIIIIWRVMNLARSKIGSIFNKNAPLIPRIEKFLATAGRHLTRDSPWLSPERLDQVASEGLDRHEEV